MKSRRSYFGDYLQTTSVAHALWRCHECERFLNKTLKAPVLDLGCGDGFFAKTVFGHLDVGIDIDKIEVARANEIGAYDNVVVGNATKLPFKNAYFNSIISNCAIEHILDLEGALSEISRVLKVNGRFIVTVPSEYFDKGGHFK